MKGFFRRLIANVAEPTPPHIEETPPLSSVDELIADGHALEDAGEHEAALARYERAVDVSPRYPRALLNRGNALSNLGRKKEAQASFLDAIDANPEYAEAHMNLGNLHLGQGEFSEAQRCYREALRQRPAWAEAIFGLGVALSSGRSADDAIDAFKSTLRADPSHGKAAARLAEALVARGDTSAARAMLLDFVSRVPGNIPALVALAGIEKDLGDCAAATECFRAAVAVAPLTRDLCDAYLFSLLFLPDIRAERIRDEHREVASRFDTVPQVGHAEFRMVSDRKLRVGYVSADFRRHSVACFFESVLRHHDRTSFEIHCYFNHAQRDGITDRFESLADAWQDIASLADEAIAQQIVNDQIDILVDLSGHTTGNRLEVFARKPAPVQFTWLGYLGTTGFASIDYRLCDRHTDPPGIAEDWQIESPARMPDAQWCYQPQVELPPASPLPMLANGFCTFGSFNQASKLNGRVLDTWADVLANVADSRLKLFGIGDSLMKERILTTMASRQIAADRIEIIGRVPIQSYFACYQEVDIALDSFPYNGATTTCDALIMGVPVATIAGDRTISRGGVSLLNTVGLPEWIAPSMGEFAPMLANLAGNPRRIADLRNELPGRMRASALMEGGRFTRNLETILRGAWVTACAKVHRES